MTPRFFIGIGFGFVLTAANYALLFAGTRRMLGQSSDRVKVILPFLNIGRYLVFGALVYLYLRLRLGSVLGLLVGVTLGILGSIVFQVASNARHRRSSTV